MASTQTMARIVGPFLLVLGATVLLRAQTLPLLMPAAMQDAPLILLTGLVTLAIGLVMIVAHNRWNGAAAIVISLLGWFTTLRGAIILLSPDVIEQMWGRITMASPTFVVAGAVLVLIGAWLAFVGWFAKST